MAGSAAQWPNAKRLLRDSQTAIEGFTFGIQLQKRTVAAVELAHKCAVQDAPALDLASRVTSTTGHLVGISKLLSEATPLSA
eukprot:2668531-Pyramimonas_sp.AAC.1